MEYFVKINVTFADIDADGDLDMFVGGHLTYNNMGIHFYENIGDSQSPIWEFISDKYQDIETSDGANFFKTTFADIDADGDLDLLFGTKNTDIFYENVGNSINPVFELESTGVLVGEDSGIYFRPVLVDIDADGDYDCIGGSSSITLPYFINTGSSEQASWELDTFNYIDMGVSRDISPDFCDIDNDGDYDLFVGIEKGLVFLYENIGSVNNSEWSLVSNNPFTLDIGYYSSPAFCDINGDEKAEMFIVGYEADDFLDSPQSSISYFTNVNSSEQPDWELYSSSYFTLNLPMNIDDSINSISFGDIDNDGDYDLFGGLMNFSGLIYFENTGDTFGPDFNSVGSIIIDFNDDGNIKYCPALVDIDDDGDLDIFISSQTGITGSSPEIRFYRNEGDQFSPIMQFDSIIDSYFGKVDFFDEDGDGDLDMFLSESFWENNIMFYRNTGDINNFNFEFEASNYENIYVGSYSTIFFFDIDNDNDEDLILGEYDGGINVFRNDGGSSYNINQLHSMNFALKNYPNPFNPSTTISFSIPDDDEIELSIYNIKGQKVKTLVNSKFKRGAHSIVWDGRDSSGNSVCSGIYFYRLTSGNQTLTKKAILMK